MKNTKPYTFDSVVRILIGLAVLIVIFLLIRRLSGVLLPFLVAWLLAYLLQPLVHFFQYKLRFKSRALSILATLLIFLGSISGLLFVMVPIIIAEIQKLSQLIVDYTSHVNVNTFLPEIWREPVRRYLSHLNIQTILEDENIMSGIKSVVPQVWTFVNGSLDFILGFSVVIIVFLYLIFILLDFEKISAGMFAVIPAKHKKIASEVILDLESGMNRYFRGQALISMIVGILFIIGFSIIGLPLAIVMGLLIAVLNLVPYLKTLTVIPVLILGVLQSFETNKSMGGILLGIFLVFAIIQVLEDMILTPRIMGKVTGLNPAVIMLSLSIWGSLMGIVGMIIALPLTTLIISYYKRYVLADEELTQNSDEIQVPKAES